MMNWIVSTSLRMRIMVLALSYVPAILASLLVALTVTPALSLLLLNGALGAAGVAAGPGPEGDVPRDPAAPGAARPGWTW